MTGAYLAAEPNQSPSHRLCHPRIVHYASLIYPESGETDHLWLTFPDLFRPYPLEAHTVRAASLLQQCQARQFVNPNCHYQLSATPSRHAFFGAEAIHRLLTVAAHPRLERPGFVIEAGMDDAAVVSGLMPGESVLRLQHNRYMPPLRKSDSRS